MSEAKQIIRKGQSKPFRRSTLQEQQQRVEKAKHLLSHGASRFQIHRVFTDKYKVVWQTAERYMRQARLELLAEEGKSRSEVRAEAIAFYKSIIIDRHSTRMEQMKARQRLDDIFGIDAPLQHRVGDPNGNAIIPMIAPVVNLIIPNNQRDDDAHNRLTSLTSGNGD
jgi:hypothetical protein